VQAEAIVLSLNMGEEPLADFTAETGTAAGDICSFIS
jgi:hypothetical protein